MGREGRTAGAGEAKTTTPTEPMTATDNQAPAQPICTANFRSTSTSPPHHWWCQHEQAAGAYDGEKQRIGGMDPMMTAEEGTRDFVS